MRAEEEIKWQSILNSFLNNPDRIYTADDSVLHDLMQAACMLLNEEASYTIKNLAVTMLHEIVFADKVTLEECWQIFWQIKHKSFSDINLHLLRGSLRNLYGHVFRFVKDTLALELPYQNIEARDQKHIIIIASQFLSYGHAPTARVLDYSYAIQKHLGIKVSIINSSEMHCYPSSALEPSINFNFVEEYSKQSVIKYNDEKFEFYQVDSMMPNLEVYIKLLNIIYDINPLLIYNIGGNCLLADLCTQFTTTVSLPCSYEIPISCSKYLLVGRKVQDNDGSVLDMISESQHVLETEMNFIVTEEVSYTRTDFNLGKDDFVICIVGNRLDKEIDNSFLTLLKDVLEIKQIHLVFIGKITGRNRMMNILSEEYSNKIHFLDYQKHCKSIIKLTDLYLNPKRNGGGRSSFEALSCGVPVITPRFGDVCYVCGGDFCVDNYDEIYSCVKKYSTDRNFYSDMREKAFNRAGELTDIQGTQKNMIDTVFKMETEGI